MSGLEPIVALGLACNVLQIIGVARETVRVAKQVYQNGELDPALTDHATRLGKLSERVRSITTATATTTAAMTTTSRGAAQHGAVQSKPNAGDIKLLELADGCLSAARDLREEVNFLCGPPTASKLAEVLKTSIKTTWRKKRLERLEGKLRDAEGLLQMGLLTRIYERTEKADGALEKFDADLRSFVEEYRKGRSDAAALALAKDARSREHVTIQIKGATDAIKTYVTQETTRVEGSLKMHITQATIQAGTSLSGQLSAAARSADEREMEAKRERLLRSLKFDRMNERRNMVAESHPETFRWVLEDGSEAGEPTDVAGSPTADADRSWGSFSNADSSWDSSDADHSRDSFHDADRSWDSFSDWLRSTEPEYWISGKPGSGKTTLVKYLLNNSRTRKFLELWSPGTILVSHFFWRPGTEMQQNIRGLFCSILHQLLEKDKASLDRILTNNINAPNKDIETDWSSQELQSTLIDVMAHYPKSIALFLDGLDEVLPADGTLALLNVVDALKRPQGVQGKVKLCLGARREPLIERKLGACPQLRLEHLNHPDLCRYATDTIIIPSEYDIAMFPGSSLYLRNADGNYVTFNCENLPTSHETRDWLVTELVSKAEGVFLWLCLTTRAIMEALYQGETITDLQHRIDALPSDLAKLYADMWTRANGDPKDHRTKDQRERAALYFQLAIDDSVHDRLTMMIATTTGMASRIRNFNPYEPGRAAWLLGLCKATMRDVEVRCAGLLRSNPIPEEGYPFSNLKPWHGTEYCDLIPYAEDDASPFEFVHRTARDFLTDTEEGQRILSANTVSEWHLRRRLIAARLASCRLLRKPLFVGREDAFAKIVIRRREDYSTLRHHLAPIASLLNALPEGDEENARAELDDLLRWCEQLFESGQLFGDHRILDDDENYQEEWPGRHHSRTWYEVAVKREHEFLLEAASIDLNIWPFILARVQALKLDHQTLSELLLHVCSITGYRYVDDDPFPDVQEEIRSDILGIESRLKLAKLLLERGACPLRKGPRRINIPVKYGDDLAHVLETPLKGLISSVWHLDRDTSLLDSNLASYFISLIKLLISYGADPDLEEFRVTYQVLNGRLFERTLHFMDVFQEETYGIGVVLAYPLSVILIGMLQTWEDQFPEINIFPEARDTAQDGARLGRLILMLHTQDEQMSYMETEEELEEELLWVTHAAQRILQNRRCYGAPVPSEPVPSEPVPSEIQQGLSRALKRRRTEGSLSVIWRLDFEVFKRAGMTSIYWGEWEDGSHINNRLLLLGN